MTDPMIITIAIIRMTGLLTDDWVAGFVTAQQIQIDRDFSGPWWLHAKVVFVPGGQPIPDQAWRVWLLDHTDQPDALGYHDLAQGVPEAKVFVAEDRACGNEPSVTISHEVLEMLADPRISDTVYVTDPSGSQWEYPREVCDACEDDRFAYDINGYKMTDFVLPSWFDPAGKAPFTFRNAVKRPFALAPGGYIGRRQLWPVPGPWSQLMAKGRPGKRTFKGPHSRTMRRFRAGAA